MSGIIKSLLKKELQASASVWSHLGGDFPLDWVLFGWHLDGAHWVWGGKSSGAGKWGSQGNSWGIPITTTGSAWWDCLENLQADLGINIRPLYTSFWTSLIPEHLPRIKHQQWITDHHYWSNNNLINNTLPSASGSQVGSMKYYWPRRHRFLLMGLGWDGTIS